MVAPFTIDADASKIMAMRARLGIPAYQQTGTQSNADLTLAWRVTSQGVEIAVTELHSFRAKLASAGMIEAEIRKQFGG